MYTALNRCCETFCISPKWRSVEQGPACHQPPTETLPAICGILRGVEIPRGLESGGVGGVGMVTWQKHSARVFLVVPVSAVALTTTLVD